jgi:hypothetical protein
MLKQHKQIKIPYSQLLHGLMGANVPGEPVAYLKSAPEALGHRYHLTFQESFDNLDALLIAVLELESGPRIALVHHAGFPENQTEVYADRQEWKQHDVVPTILRTLDIPESDVSWRQDWPHSVLTG